VILQINLAIGAIGVLRTKFANVLGLVPAIGILRMECDTGTLRMETDTRTLRVKAAARIQLVSLPSKFYEQR
jgi:hypothetical protein